MQDPPAQTKQTDQPMPIITFPKPTAAFKNDRDNDDP